mmetsp:Transcript_7113/g.11267  ORF Transcript_7113/g.11267 Transcript_7113/m.11267 type:complete len:98 (-) Transcript_7113:1941-2234(-)
MQCIAVLSLSLFILMNTVLLSLFSSARFVFVKMAMTGIYVYCLFFRVFGLGNESNVVVASLIFFLTFNLGLLVITQFMRFDKQKGQKIRKEIGLHLE